MQEPADEEDNQKKVMLIADEDEDYRREVRKTFEERYRIVEATSGQEALNYAARDQYKIAVMLLSMTLRHQTAIPCWRAFKRKRRYGDSRDCYGALRPSAGGKSVGAWRG